MGGTNTFNELNVFWTITKCSWTFFTCFFFTTAAILFFLGKFCSYFGYLDKMAEILNMKEFCSFSFLFAITDELSKLTITKWPKTAILFLNYFLLLDLGRWKHFTNFFCLTKLLSAAILFWTISEGIEFMDIFWPLFFNGPTLKI